MTFEEEMAVMKGIGSDMEIDDEELERISSSPPVQNDLEKKDEPIDPIDPVKLVDVPKDVAVGQKRLYVRPCRMQRGMMIHMPLS